MKRTPIVPKPEQFPEEFRPLLCSCPVYDSSCSPEARVFSLDRKGGLYLKAAPTGTLKTEAEMPAFFHGKGLSAEVLAYLPEEKDWLLTRAVKGEDCLHPDYLANPKRLAETMGQILYDLHHRDFTNCPVQDHTARYLARAKEQGMTENASVSVIVGDFQRIDLYAALGYQLPQEIPPEAWMAFHTLVSMGFDTQLA